VRAWCPVGAAFAVLVACGNQPEPSRVPTAGAASSGDVASAAPPDASATDAAASSAATPPPGERWVAPGDAAKLATTTAQPASEVACVVIEARVVLDELHTARVRTPRAGKVHDVFVAAGQTVKKGAPLMVVDAASGPVTLKAPIAAQVVLVGTAQGSTVDEGRDLVVLSDMDRVIVAADDMPVGVAGGAPATFRLPSLAARTWATKLAGISPDVPHLRAAVDNHDHVLQPADTGTLAIVKKDAPGFVVPRAALLPGGGAVLVRRGDAPDGRARFVETPVKRAFDAGGQVLAVEGLAAGDVVVADAASLPR